MIPLALLEKFLSLQFIASVKVSNIARCSSESDELRKSILLNFFLIKELLDSTLSSATADVL